MKKSKERILYWRKGKIQAIYGVILPPGPGIVRVEISTYMPNNGKYILEIPERDFVRSEKIEGKD